MDTNGRDTINLSDGRIIRVERMSEPGEFGTEYAITVGNRINRYVTGSAEQAYSEAVRIARGIEFDLAWMSGKS